MFRSGDLFTWHDILRIVQTMRSPRLSRETQEYIKEYIALVALTVWLQSFLWRQPVPSSLFRRQRQQLQDLIEEKVDEILPFSDWLRKFRKFLD